ncbi:MAG: cyclic nucleotide-binding domain-containing protein [Gammaproteobacteria bacterium]|nr:cyclic nucleotide-binding domain-containing protein [Gammaproteobacteria bacterium]MCP5298507.1 cyclic nucleotide-binding domain-containing protein [Chromatiaceae bacterium]
MKHKDELIHELVGIVTAADGHEDCLFLPHWTDSTWKSLLAEAQAMELANGEILLRRDEVSNDLYFLVEGELGVSIPHVDGVTLTSQVTRYPGSIVGEIAFLDGGFRTASVWSRGRSVLLRVPESAFDAFVESEPRLACDVLRAIGRIVAERLRRSIGASPRDPVRAG